MKTRNEAILIGLMLKAQAMTPICILFGSDACDKSFSALLASLVLAFVLSAIEHSTTVWKTVVLAASATSLAVCAELLWLEKIARLSGPIGRYGIFSTTLFVGLLFLGMGCLVAVLHGRLKSERHAPAK